MQPNFSNVNSSRTPLVKGGLLSIETERAETAADDKNPNVINYPTRLDKLNLESAMEKNRWKPADKAEGEMIYQQNTFQKWNPATQSYEKISVFANLDEFIPFGSGIYLFFWYMKQLIYIFGFMSLAAGASVYLCYRGSNLMPAQVNTYLDYTSIANLGVTKTVGIGGTTGTIATDKILSIENNRVGVYLLDILCTIIFFISLIIYRCRLSRQIEKCDGQFLTVSDYTAEIKGFDKFTTFEDIEAVVRNFGPSVEIILARDYCDSFETYKKIAKLETRERYAYGLIQANIGNTADSQRKIELLKQRIVEKKKKIYTKLRSDGLTIMNHEDFPPTRAFVVFKEIASKKKMFAAYEAEQKGRSFLCFSCCKKPYPKTPEPGSKYLFHIRGKGLEVSTSDEPSNIRFEHLGVKSGQRFRRRLVALVLVLIVILICFFVMYLLSRLENFPTGSDCSTVYDVQAIQASAALSKDPEVIYCFCSKRSMSDFNNVVIINYCRDYLLAQTYELFINIGLAFIVMLVGFLIQEIVSGLSLLMAFTKISKEVTTITFIIFWSDMLNYMCLTILLRGKYYGFQPSKLISYILQPISPTLVANDTVYSNFNTAWYLDIGSKMMSRFVIYILIPHGFTLIFMPILRCFTFSKAKSAKLQHDLIVNMKGTTFAMPKLCAKILTQIFLTLIFSPGLPVIIILSFLFLVVYYWIVKFNTVRYYQKPPQLDHDLAEYTAKFMTLAISAHCACAIIAYSSSGIFNVPSTVGLPSTISDQLGWFGQIDYQNYAAYYAIGSLSLAWSIWDFVLGNILLNLVCPKKSDVNEEENDKNNEGKKVRKPNFVEAVKNLGASSISSYNIRNHPAYRDVFIAMDLKGNQVLGGMNNIRENGPSGRNRTVINQPKFNQVAPKAADRFGKLQPLYNPVQNNSMTSNPNTSRNLKSSINTPTSPYGNAKPAGQAGRGAVTNLRGGIIRGGSGVPRGGIAFGGNPGAGPRNLQTAAGAPNIRGGGGRGGLAPVRGGGGAISRNPIRNPTITNQRG